MTLIDILKCLLCAAGIGAGQVLFKLASNRLAVSSSPTDFLFLLIVGASFALYGITSIAWIWILQRTPLSSAYAVLAATYVIVPLCAMLIFGESIKPTYWIGAALIGFGIFITMR